ncbi:flavin-containing monooxygenase [Chitinophaga solisilvae]|uniref:flavin-containing monooxygenase n=1 Tax=Chitinophaga solisilvae TaxID=1233460 RepID=UPI00136F69FC|nr:NAD(P)-binding domain-containing protein [Chitinophaga solisilvae]
MASIGIIGAGVSGLVTAKTFLEGNHHVSVLEKTSGIGGVWKRDHCYFGASTQTTRDEYAFSDYPMPASFPEWPSGEQILSYLRNYATHFGLSQHIRFNTEVIEMKYLDNIWSVEVFDRKKSKNATLLFDFVIICTGTFNVPYIPAFEGMQEFIDHGGKVLHTTDVSDASLVENKSVVVVGFAKSATDVATLVTDHAKDCTLIYRKARWKVPRYFANIINLKYLLLSRYSEIFITPPHKSGNKNQFRLPKRLFAWLQWRMVELLLKKQFRLKSCNMIPEDPIETQINCALGVAHPDFYPKIRKGQIKAIQTEIDRFNGSHIELKNGSTIKPDLIIFGTGFLRRLPFLEEKNRNIIFNEETGFQLYRNIIHPDIPQLAFVGFNTSFVTSLTSEIASHWVLRLVNGNLQLPSKDKIKEEILTMSAWQQHRNHVTSTHDGTCIAPLNLQYLDKLMKDMGLPRKVSKLPLYDFIRPVSPKDYYKLLKYYKKNVTG